MSKSPFSQKKYENLKRVILEFLSGKNYTPLGTRSLFKKLGLTDANELIGKEIVNQFLKEGIIEIFRKKIRLKKSSPSRETIIGKISVHPRGFGFVTPQPSSSLKKDVFIPSSFTDNAVEGDTVEVWLFPQSQWKKGPEGEVISILKRSKTHLAGVVSELQKNQKTALVHAPLLGPERLIKVKKGKLKLEKGDRIRVKILDWGKERQSPALGIAEKKIGHIDDAATDILSAIEEYDLSRSFSKKALQETKAFGDQVKKKDLVSRKNLTHLLCFTIDPETAKDFDDALSLEKYADGTLELGVHIADVAHYIQSGSALDSEAFERGNSVYLPGHCIPMLPKSLSNGLCSLKPNVIRLTVSVFMQFDHLGNLKNYTIERSFIKSAKRFTYEEAKHILDRKKRSKYFEKLTLMESLCNLLKEKRRQRGSVDLALPEIFLILDKKGFPTGYKTIEYDITHQLVEEFMIKANEIVAFHLSKIGKDAIFRIHEPPAAEDLNDFFSFARVLGFPLPQSPKPKDIQKLFQFAKETPFAHRLAISFIRSMRLAIYSHENVGHYGLALEHYCHFTSPIRRYTDLIVQRLLFNEENESLDMEQIAKHCSEKERFAFRAESSVLQLKKLRFIKQQLKQNTHHLFEAVISSIKPFGITLTLLPLEIEGFLHISKLGNDYYIYQNQSQTLKGERTGQVFSIGQVIHLHIESIDLISGEIKWNMPSQPKKRKK